jgi:hypothetical protein
MASGRPTDVDSKLSINVENDCDSTKQNTAVLTKVVQVLGFFFLLKFYSFFYMHRSLKLYRNQLTQGGFPPKNLIWASWILVELSKLICTRRKFVSNNFFFQTWTTIFKVAVWCHLIYTLTWHTVAPMINHCSWSSQIILEKCSKFIFIFTGFFSSNLQTQ